MSDSVLDELSLYKMVSSSSFEDIFNWKGLVNVTFIKVTFTKWKGLVKLNFISVLPILIAPFPTPVI